MSSKINYNRQLSNAGKTLTKEPRRRKVADCSAATVNLGIK